MMRRIAKSELAQPPLELGRLGAAAPVDDLLHAHQLYEHALTQARQDMVAAVLEVTQSVLSRELTQSSAHIEALVASAIKPLARARSLSIQVHPEDLSALPSAAVLSEQLALHHVELVANPELERGDCLVTSPLGDVDARIATKLEAVAARLSERFKP